VAVYMYSSLLHNHNSILPSNFEYNDLQWTVKNLLKREFVISKVVSQRRALAGKESGTSNQSLSRGLTVWYFWQY
jgi:hypothetical protein